MGANGEALLDVRWLATRVRREQGARLAGAMENSGISLGGIALAEGVAVTKAWRTGPLAEPKSVRLPEGWVPHPQTETLALPASPARAQVVAAGHHVGTIWRKEADDARR
jgi:hypothetical protein